MNFPGMPGGGGGGGTAGMSDQEVAMVKAVSRSLHDLKSWKPLTSFGPRCKELWKAVPSRLLFREGWVLPLEELLDCSCQAYVAPKRPL